MKTQSTRQSQIERKWHLVDLNGKILGRIAGEIAVILRGKNKPYFVANLDCGDFVVLINASLIKTTGKKDEQKVYTSYSGYPSGQRRETLGMLKKRKPEEVIRHAVMGMLPKNKLRDEWMKRLYIYAQSTHPYGSQLKQQ